MEYRMMALPGRLTGAKTMNEPHLEETYLGYAIYYEGISYNCPALKERGYAYIHNLKRAMRRKIKKIEARNVSKGFTPNGETKFGCACSGDLPHDQQGKR